MASISLGLKREAAVQGYSALIRSVSGSNPHVSRSREGSDITMSDYQAKELENFIGSKIPFNLFYIGDKLEEKKAEEEGEGLNVNVNWNKVFIPLAIKTLIPPFILYTLFVLYIGKKRFS